MTIARSAGSPPTLSAHYSERALSCKEPVGGPVRVRCRRHQAASVLPDLPPVRDQYSCGMKKNESGEEQLVGWVAGFVPVAVAQPVKEFLEAGLFLFRHLDADPHPAIVRAVVAIVEQADVPAAAHALQ